MELFDTKPLNDFFGLETFEETRWMEWDESCYEEMNVPFPGCLEPLSEEHKRLISLSLKGRKLSEEHKENLSLSHKGKLHKPHLQETKEKIRQGHLGKKLSEEHRRNLSLSHRGKRQPHKQETKDKLSKLFKGREMNEEWKRKSKEGTQRKMRELHTKTYLFTSPSGETFLETTTLSDFSKKHNLNKNLLSQVLNGKRNHTGGWKVSYPS